MTLETVFRPFSLLTIFAQIGNDGPPPSGMQRKIHWVGQKDATEQKQDGGKKKKDTSGKKKESSGYLPLSDLTFSQVNDAHRFYADQLVSSPYPAWIAPHYFSLIHLKPRHDDRPPAVFGRIKTCYPGDGHVQNIQQMELLIPSKTHGPDLIRLRANDILMEPNSPVQSFCVKVPCLFHPDEMAEFKGREALFLQQGFLLEFQTGYIDLLDINEDHQRSLPWLYVIGSRWFASIPASIQPEVRDKLTRLIHWNKPIFNFHPEALQPEIRTLNRELGLKAGFTDTFLIEPEDAPQSLQIVAKTFDHLFNQPIP